MSNAARPSRRFTRLMLSPSSGRALDRQRTEQRILASVSLSSVSIPSVVARCDGVKPAGPLRHPEDARAEDVPVAATSVAAAEPRQVLIGVIRQYQLRVLQRPAPHQPDRAASACRIAAFIIIAMAKAVSQGPCMLCPHGMVGYRVAARNRCAGCRHTWRAVGSRPDRRAKT